MDTGPLLARYLKRDQYHKRSVSLWKEIERSSVRCVLTPYVISEATTLLARRAGPAFAVGRIEKLYDSPIFRIVRPSGEDEQQALQTMLRYEDQDLSFTDAISFVVMQREGLQTAFSFDAHFRLPGFALFGSVSGARSKT